MRVDTHCTHHIWPRDTHSCHPADLGRVLGSQNHHRPGEPSGDCSAHNSIKVVGKLIAGNVAM
jgi:hypothetical protein